MRQFAPIVSDEHQIVERLEREGGHGQQISSQRRWAWLRRNVRQVWLGERIGPRQR